MSDKTQKTEKKSSENHKSRFVTVENLRQFHQALNKKFDTIKSEYIDTFAESSRQFGQGLRADARKIFAEYYEKGKQRLPEIPQTKAIKSRVSNGINSLTNYLNLPSGQDIQKLDLAMETLNSKIDRLNRK